MTGMELLIGLVLGGAVFAAGLFLGQRLARGQTGDVEARFSDLATRIFEERNRSFREQSQVTLGAILDPLKHDLENFRKKVEESYGEEAKERRSLQNEVRSIVLQTENLASALRGDSKVQGDLGEMLLEKILEDSGLRAGENYRKQDNVKGVDGQNLRPDYIVLLPDKRHVILDAKMSLTAYERYVAAKTEGEKENCKAELLKSIAAHVKNLAEKEYFNAAGVQSPDFVLMFVPLEGAFLLALQADRTLHSRAWERKVIIVSATTLMATLRTIEAMWRLERQNRNAQDIARQAGGIYDKYVGFLADMKAIAQHLDRARGAWDEGMKKLATGKDNLSVKLEKLKGLGAKTAKDIPEEFIGDETEAPPRIEDAA